MHVDHSTSMNAEYTTITNLILRDRKRVNDGDEVALRAMRAARVKAKRGLEGSAG
jgi:hypothetical protein